MATQRPSSSTSEVSKKREGDRWEYEVFLSFRGKDTRRVFTDHLHADLQRKGIVVFMDDEKLQQGEYISQALLKAIQQSQYAIVILSANYAFSKWCLRELAEIVECKKKTKPITIMPIFYHVEPSDVRNLRETFAKAFAAHENDPKVDIKEIDMWRNAFREVGTIVGEHINGDKNELTIIQEVCGRISRELNSRSSRLNYSELVAIDSHADEMMKLLNMEPNDVRFIGIHGMGGIGKTTLAELIYDRVSCLYEGSKFIYFRGESGARGLASLQQQLLRKILDEELTVGDHREGSEVISRRLRDKKVFIVLDDVDSDEQLRAFARDREWFGPGSRVIITCRDRHLLIRNKVNDICEVQLLQTADALQLFSRSAFDKTNPPENYKDLSMNFVHYSGGLPLALTVLGRFLFGRKIDAWKSASDQLEANPKPEIFDVLKISFDGLEESQQNLFLDMACCRSLGLTGEDYFKKIYPAIDIEVLVDKSLLIKSYDEWELEMHDLLEKMGQEIVHRQCPDEPGRRSRLFRAEDVVHVLKNNTGTDAIKMLALDFYDLDQANHRFTINAEAIFSKMRKLRFLLFDGFGSCINWRGNPLNHMPSDKLQLLHWRNCPSESWPRSFQPKNLVVLTMPGSCFKRLWEGLMVFDNLKILNLSDSRKLIETPDLSGAPNLEKIDFSNCKSLYKVHPSIGFLKRLKHLSLKGCSRLGNFLNIQGDMMSLESLSLPSSEVSILPSVIYSLSSLKGLWLDGWSRLEKFPDLSRLECLKEFKAYETAISQIPSINLIPKSIHSFELKGGKRMPRESRDLVMFNNDCSLPKQSSYPTNHDIGSPVEYEMEEKFWVRIHFGNPYLQVLIQRCSLGSRIPEWVHNKCNGSSLFFDMCKGSSLKIELDDNTMPVMGIAIFIVCQFHSIPPVNSLIHERVAFPIWLDDGTPENPFCEFSFALSTDVILDKPIVLSEYFWKPRYLNSWKLKSLDKRKISTTAKFVNFASQTRFPLMEVEVKKWGLHLVCPDDAALGLGSDLDSFVNFINLGLKPRMTRMKTRFIRSTL